MLTPQREEEDVQEKGASRGCDRPAEYRRKGLVMRDRSSHLLWAMLLPIGGTSTVRAQEISFQASVDRNAFAVGGVNPPHAHPDQWPGQPHPPDLGGLGDVQGPFQSPPTCSSVNGRMSSSMSRTYVLTATRPGSYTIGLRGGPHRTG